MKFHKSLFRSAALLAASLSALALFTPAWAGIFSVTPIRIYMAPKDRAVAVTITNEGENALVLQADLYNWSQKEDGTDSMVLTDDLLMSPPIIKLAPKARQVVRLAMLVPRDPTRQMTYRMVMREVPEAMPSKERIAVPIALALNMPVFITPPAAKRSVACELKRADTHTLLAVCANTGTAYAQVREITLKQNDKKLAGFEGGNYILPGAHKEISLKTETEGTSGAAELSVTFDDFSSQSYPVTISSK